MSSVLFKGDQQLIYTGYTDCHGTCKKKKKPSTEGRKQPDQASIIASFIPSDDSEVKRSKAKKNK